MLCFEVRLNGQMVARAGVDDGVVTAIVTSVTRPAEDSRRLNLNIGGLTQGTHYDWEQPPIQIGDRIEILVVDGGIPDRPVRRHRDSEASTEEAERRQYERLKQKYES